MAGGLRPPALPAPAVLSQRLCNLLLQFPAASIDGVKWRILVRKYEERYAGKLDIAAMGYPTPLAAATALLFDVVRVVSTEDVDNPIIAADDSAALSPRTGHMATWPSLYKALCAVARMAAEPEDGGGGMAGTNGLLLAQLKPLLQQSWDSNFDESSMSYITQEGSVIKVKKLKHLVQTVLKWRDERVEWRARCAGVVKSKIDEALRDGLELVASKRHNDFLLRMRDVDEEEAAAFPPPPPPPAPMPTEVSLNPSGKRAQNRQAPPQTQHEKQQVFQSQQQPAQRQAAHPESEQRQQQTRQSFSARSADAQAQPPHQPSQSQKLQQLLVSQKGEDKPDDEQLQARENARELELELEKLRAENAELRSRHEQLMSFAHASRADADECREASCASSSARQEADAMETGASAAFSFNPPSRLSEPGQWESPCVQHSGAECAEAQCQRPRERRAREVFDDPYEPPPQRQLLWTPSAASTAASSVAEPSFGRTMVSNSSQLSSAVMSPNHPATPFRAAGFDIASDGTSRSSMTPMSSFVGASGSMTPALVGSSFEVQLDGAATAAASLGDKVCALVPVWFSYMGSMPSNFLGDRGVIPTGIVERFRAQFESAASPDAPPPMPPGTGVPTAASSGSVAEETQVASALQE